MQASGKLSILIRLPCSFPIWDYW